MTDTKFVKKGFV